MTTPKKKYRNKKQLLNDDNIEYSEEEAEILGLSNDDLIDDPKEDEELIDEDIDDIEEEVIEEIIENKKEEPKKRKKATDKTKFYVDPKEFDEKIIHYYETGILSNELAEMVSKIAHKLSYAPNFINYSYREEMVGDGIIRMFKALMSKKYSHNKGSNPFSYFTRIAFNAFRNRIKKEKHIHETHEKYQNEFLMFSENYNNLMKNNKLKMYKGNKEE
jgi:hypothetical protein